MLTAAGIEINEDSIDVTADNWRKVIDVNLTGTFFSAQAFGRGLLGAGLPGSAILVSSMSGSIVNVPPVGCVLQLVQGGSCPPR